MSGEKSAASAAPREWFTANLKYEGIGSAEFISPQGQITGPAVATFDDSGRTVVYLDGNLLARSDSAHGWRVLGFLSSAQPSESSTDTTISIGSWGSNPCAKLTIETQEGVFIAGCDGHYGLSIPGESGYEVRLTFHPLRSEFRPAAPDAARYWVLPLFNFICDFVQRADVLNNHPLRVYREIPVLEGLSGQEERLRRLIAEQRNRLVVFQFEGDPGFIEPLPDYDARVVTLRNRDLARTVTAVMVGAVGDNSIEIADVVKSWLPCHFLDLLSLATGSRIGSPWIEFRDAEGRLVRRVHIQLGLPHFSQCRPAMDERRYPGTGQLLSTARFPQYFTPTDLRVTVRHLIDAWADGIPMEEMLGHVCRAVERLATAIGVASRDMLDDVDERLGQRVRDALCTASREISGIAQEARRTGNAAEGDGIELISRWLTSGKASKDAGFGRAVLRLLERFGLADAQLMARASKGNASRWAAELSEYRSIPMHAGHFDVRSPRHNPDRLVATWRHLTDITVRVLLKILGYKGKYHPAVGLSPQVVRPLDWVKPDFDQRHLGYE